MRLNEFDKPPLEVKTSSALEIAKKHGVSLKKIKDELALGILVELEHTTSKEAAEEIALDHLSELPDYYSKLKKMEND